MANRSIHNLADVLDNVYMRDLFGGMLEPFWQATLPIHPRVAIRIYADR
jgi:hypothetical protein